MRLSIALRFAIFLTAGLLYSPRVLAADQITFKYGAFRGAIPVRELADFANTGAISSSLQFYLDAGQQNPEDFRRVLAREVDVNITTLDRMLNNPVGGLLLDRIGQTIHPPSDRAVRQALRSALVLSAAEDGKISLIEVMQNYPTAEVEVEGDRLVQAVQSINGIAGQIRGLEDWIRIFQPLK